jgi:peptide/nickel transport system substrate-binding protein
MNAGSLRPPWTLRRSRGNGNGGRAGRRSAIVLPAAVVACAALAAACSSAASSSGSSSSSPAASTTAALKTLVVAAAAAPPTLDPTSNASQAIDQVVDYNVLQHLVQLAPNGTIVPVLATGYTLSADRKTYTFTIRQGVKFSNGDPLTPADVVFSINRVNAKGSQYPYATIFNVASAKVVGTNQVAVTLKAPDWSWLFNLAAYSNGVILDPATVSTLGTDPVGTGPYTISGNVANYSTTLKVNPTYWGQKPGVAGVEFRYFTDPNAEVTAIQNGQVQVGYLPTPSDLSTFKSDPSKYGVISGLTNGKVQLTINNTAGPFKSLLVRQAVNYAINKNTVNQVAAGGEGVTIGTDSVPSDPYYVNLASLYSYNPAKAKQLLAQAGYPNGFSTTLTLPPYYYATLAAPIIQSELGAIGIKVAIKNVALPLWLSRVFEGGDFDLTIIDHAEARDVSNYGTTGYYWHYAGTSKVAAQLAAANAAPTQAQWIAGTQGVLKEIADDAVNAWLYVLPGIQIYDKGVTGLATTGYTESQDLQYATYGGTLPAAAAGLGYTSS